ncbi:CaaX farnesyltransferase beta subunit Ram1 [Arthroderma uncinatum]|uniref:CaaX farnesyltransferase beta subunit Ram1 n=1 Tax=Arthroderma uncinatum TaxID=74035 RepID=UPI00144A85EC|nr:CaaX farnesyltransferase beta subunit Ram1 [Arthroderma uncinatum]KAF3481299.1 CaaX farnesyltransferase beta subunit Ram1 [Arthroderma uncinatum]
MEQEQEDAFEAMYIKAKAQINMVIDGAPRLIEWFRVTNERLVEASEESGITEEEILELNNESSEVCEKITELQEQLIQVTANSKIFERIRCDTRTIALESRRMIREKLSSGCMEDIDKMLIHAGNITADIDAIRYNQHSPHVEQYKENFHETYGISFARASAQIHIYPPEVIRTFNILGALDGLRFWWQSDLYMAREAIGDLGLEIIHTMARTDPGKLWSLFREDKCVLEKFNRMEELFTKEQAPGSLTAATDASPGVQHKYTSLLMPLSVATKHRRRVRFPRQQTQPSQPSASSIPPQDTSKVSNQKTNQKPKKKKKENPQQMTMASPDVPSIFTTLPPLIDKLETETSKSQSEVTNKCIPFLTGEASSMPPNKWGVQRLNRDLHVAYLVDALGEYPANFVGLDASRPWMVYWAITGLYLLGEDVREYEKRVVATAAPMQNPTGGFGGGHGQMSHCASSYALTLSLAMTGSPEAFKLVDRVGIWKWLGQLKQADGGFQVSKGGEEDVRGAYCAMVMIALLDIPVELPPDAPARQFGHETFMSGLPEYLSRCQTYEGGISGSPGTEAHGAYAYCAIACLCIMGHPWAMINNIRPRADFQVAQTS